MKLINTKSYNTYIAPRAANAAAAALLCHRQNGRTANTAQLKPAPTDFDLLQTAICSPGLPFNGLHPVIHVITWIITHLVTDL